MLSRQAPSPTSLSETQDLATWQGHSAQVNALITLPDGRIVSGSNDKTLRYWDATSGECIATIPAHAGAVLALTVLPDGRLVSGSSDYTIKIWGSKGESTLKEHSDSVQTLLVLSDERFVSGSNDRSIKIWDTKKNKCLMTLQGHTGGVFSLAALPDGRSIISGSSDHTIKIWDTKKNKCLMTLQGHTGSVKALLVLENGQLLVSGSSDHTIKIWDIKTGECLSTLKGHSNSVESLLMLPEGQLASGSSDRTIKFWNPKSRQCLSTLKGHSDSILALILADGFHLVEEQDKLNKFARYLTKAKKKQLVSASSDNTLKLWPTTPPPISIPETPCIATWQGHSSSIDGIAVLPKGQIATSSRDMTVKIWDPKTRQCLSTINVAHEWGFPVNLAMLPGGRLATNTRDTTRIWDINTKECLMTLNKTTGPLVILADGRLVNNSEEAIKIWDTTTGTCLFTQNNAGKLLAVFPDGRLVTTSKDHTIKIWSPKRGESLTLRGHSEAVRACVVLPNGQLASGSYDKTIKFWDTSTGECLRTLDGHFNLIFALLVAPDGRLISSSADKTIKLWDIETGKCLTTLEGELSKGAYTLFVSPKGELLSGSEDGIIKIWRLPSPQPTFKTQTTIASPLPKSSVTSPATISAPFSQLTLSLELSSQDVAYNRQTDLLGKGTFGAVYRGTYQKHTAVAVKELFLTQANETLTAEFLHEMRIMGSLRHNNIVQLYGVITAITPYCMVMDFFAKGSLFKVLHTDAKQEPLPWSARLNIAQDIARGLAYLHGQNPRIIHRDLKSLNVLLDANYTAKLADFGLATIRHETASHSTLEHTAVGTLFWMAPELFQRKAIYTDKSDMYAYGMILWELATREVPFKDSNGNHALIMSWVMNGTREDIPALTPQPFASLINRCWEAVAEQRPSATEALTLLGASGSPAKAAVITPDPRNNLDTMMSMASPLPAARGNLHTNF